MSLTLQQISALSNVALDQTYSDAYKGGDGVTAAMAGSEIASRLSSPMGFFNGLIGNNQFPLYSAILANGYGVMPQSQSAQTAVADSAANVANSLKFGFGSVLVVAGILGVAYIIFKVKK